MAVHRVLKFCCHTLKWTIFLCIVSKKKHPIYISHSKLTPRSRVLLEKLTVSQLVKKFPAFYETQIFITQFTSARHHSLSRTRSIQFMPIHFIKTHLHIIFPSTPGSSNCLFSSGFQIQTPYAPFFSPISPHPHPSYLSRFDHPNNTG